MLRFSVAQTGHATLVAFCFFPRLPPPSKNLRKNTRRQIYRRRRRNHSQPHQLPAQNNTNFGGDPGYRNQDVLIFTRDTNWNPRNLEPAPPRITPISYHLPNSPGTPETGEYRFGRCATDSFISPKKPES